MAGEGKNKGDDRPALGWDLFKWKWIREPPVGATAAVYGILLIVFFVIAASGVVGLFLLLAPILTGSPVANPPGTDPGAELRGRLLVIGALLTTPFLVWRLVVGHWSARAAQEQAKIAQETARNSLFTKAIEQLGAMREVTRTVQTPSAGRFVGRDPSFHDETQTVPNTEVRLGAIYALEKLARDDLAMHWPIMETLCAYIRENAGKPKPLPENVVAILAREDDYSLTEEDKNQLSTYREMSGQPTVDVLAAISVIGRRGARQCQYERAQRVDPRGGERDAWRLDLRNSHLARANFAGFDFAAARFNDSTLHWSEFREARFEGANFDGAHLEAAALFKAHLESASFDGAHLRGAWLERAHLEGGWLRGADLEGASLAQAELDDV